MKRETYKGEGFIKGFHLERSVSKKFGLYLIIEECSLKFECRYQNLIKTSVTAYFEILFRRLWNLSHFSENFFFIFFLKKNRVQKIFRQLNSSQLTERVIFSWKYFSLIPSVPREMSLSGKISYFLIEKFHRTYFRGFP